MGSIVTKYDPTNVGPPFPLSPGTMHFEGRQRGGFSKVAIGFGNFANYFRDEMFEGYFADMWAEKFLSSQWGLSDQVKGA